MKMKQLQGAICAVLVAGAAPGAAARPKAECVRRFKALKQGFRAGQAA